MAAKDDVERFQNLRAEVADLRSQKDRAEGALLQLVKELREEFKVRTIGQAKKLLRTLESEAVQKEKKFRRALDAFEQKWRE